MILLHYTLCTFTLVAFLIFGLGYANLELNQLITLSRIVP